MGLWENRPDVMEFRCEVIMPLLNNSKGEAEYELS